MPTQITLLAVIMFAASALMSSCSDRNSTEYLSAMAMRCAKNDGKPKLIKGTNGEDHQVICLPDIPDNSPHWEEINADYDQPQRDD